MMPPAEPTLDNYKLVLENDFARYFANSVIVTVGSVVPALLVSFMAAYAIVRGKSRFLGWTNNLFLLGLAIPLQATIIPIYWMITKCPSVRHPAGPDPAVGRLRHPDLRADPVQLHPGRPQGALRVHAAGRLLRLGHDVAPGAAA